MKTNKPPFPSQKRAVSNGTSQSAQQTSQLFKDNSAANSMSSNLAAIMQRVKKDTLQRKFYGDGDWMQDVNDETLLAKFGGTTSSLWKALRDNGITFVKKESSSFAYSSENKRIYIDGSFLDAIKEYVVDDKKGDLTNRAISALTHEMSHAHDFIVKGETPTGKSKDNDDYVTEVFKTELKAWMKEARAARENSKGKELKSHSDDNELVFSWVGIKYMIDDGKDILTTSNNTVVNRAKLYFNKNKSESTETTLAELIESNFKEIIKNYAGQIRAKFTTQDSAMREHCKTYMT